MKGMYTWFEKTKKTCCYELLNFFLCRFSHRIIPVKDATFLQLKQLAHQCGNTSFIASYSTEYQLGTVAALMYLWKIRSGKGAMVILDEVTGPMLLVLSHFTTTQIEGLGYITV